jgi:tetratricopeptide (TPR) repeat protein
MSHYNQKNYDKAIADFSEAIKLHPKAAEYYRWRGFAYDELAQYDKTIADYTEVIRLEPKLAMNYFNRGLAYNKKEDFSSAVSDFTKALKLTPDDADYLFNRAIAYGNNGEYELAIADMEIAKTKFPQEFNAPDSLLTVYREALATPHKRGRPVVAYAAAKKSALSYEYEASGQRSGTVYFYREGNKINDGVLRVFDSHKNLVKRVTVSDRGQGGQNKRSVGSWDITNLHGKPVRPGTYSVSGTVSTRDGRNEEVSLTVELR